MSDRRGRTVRVLAPAGLLALCVAAATPAAAQEWRDVTSFRQRSDERALDVRVRYGAGELVIRPGATGELYRVGMRYDAEVFEPITDYASGTLEVGVRGSGRGIKLRNNQSGEMTLSLAPDLPLDLDFDFGAVEARLELGGLRVRRLDVETGASDTELRFSRPNPEPCERLDVSMGAAAFRAEGLGNANCRRLSFEGGVGDITLDFSGEWNTDVEADIAMALGSITMVVPEDIGVRVEKQTFLTDFDGPRTRKRDGVYFSDNWDTARHRLSVELTGAFGSVNLRWTGAAGVATP